MTALSGGMALGAVLGPIVAAGPGWQGNFIHCSYCSCFVICMLEVHSFSMRVKNTRARFP